MAKLNQIIAIEKGVTMPQRIQRQRTKGWRMPPNTIYVGRPTRWGNWYKPSKTQSVTECVALYRREWEDFIAREADALPRLKRNLGGRDLACWCSLSSPCHADVLLELANRDDVLLGLPTDDAAQRRDHGTRQAVRH